MYKSAKNNRTTIYILLYVKAYTPPLSLLSFASITLCIFPFAHHKAKKNKKYSLYNHCMYAMLLPSLWGEQKHQQIQLSL